MAKHAVISQTRKESLRKIAFYISNRYLRGMPIKLSKLFKYRTWLVSTGERGTQREFRRFWICNFKQIENGFTSQRVTGTSYSMCKTNDKNRLN